MRNTLLCLVVIMMVFVIAGCEEGTVYTSPGVSQGVDEIPIYYHPVHPNFGYDKSMYVNANDY
jgi:hypothetical protein